MAKAMAVVDYDRCDPRRCGQEPCPAAKACPTRILRQEGPGEVPMALGPCRGCATCVTACPLRAIKML